MHEASMGKGTIILILIVIAFAALMDGVDASIVNVALPVLAAEFGTDTGTIAWVTVIYFIMMAGLMIPFARIAKNGSLKKVLFGGLLLFTVSSLFCGLSDNFPMLMIFRTAQGVGAAMMGASVPMLCVKFLPVKSLGLGLGILTMGSSLGFAIGPALGGIMIDIVSWHWLFLINVPMGLIILPLVLKVLPKDEKMSGNVDIIGAILLFTTILFGALALERMPYSGESSLVLISTFAFFICISLFIFVELRKHDPILNVRVFKHHKFNAVFLAYLTINAAYMGILYLLPFYLNNTMGFSSSISGAYLFIPPLITLIVCIPISRWSDRIGNRRSFSIIACLMMLMSFLSMSLFGRDGSLIPLIVALGGMGMMWGFCGGPMASRIVEEISDESREIGSTLMNESIYLGGTVGTALFAMVFTFGSGAGNVNFADLPSEIFLDGFELAMIVGVAISMVSLILSFLVSEKRSA